MVWELYVNKTVTCMKGRGIQYQSTGRPSEKIDQALNIFAKMLLFITKLLKANVQWKMIFGAII